MFVGRSPISLTCLTTLSKTLPITLDQSFQSYAKRPFHYDPDFRFPTYPTLILQITSHLSFITETSGSPVLVHRLRLSSGHHFLLSPTLGMTSLPPPMLVVYWSVPVPFLTVQRGSLLTLRRLRTDNTPRSWSPVLLTYMSLNVFGSVLDFHQTRHHHHFPPSQGFLNSL